MTQTETPVYRSKIDLEDLIKAHGGIVFQSENARKNIIVLAEKGTDLSKIFVTPPTRLMIELVKVAALKRRGTHDILRPQWLFDSIDIGFLIPLEPR